MGKKSRRERPGESATASSARESTDGVHGVPGAPRVAQLMGAPDWKERWSKRCDSNLGFLPTPQLYGVTNFVELCTTGVTTYPDQFHPEEIRPRAETGSHLPTTLPGRLADHIETTRAMNVSERVPPYLPCPQGSVAVPLPCLVETVCCSQQST